VRECGLQGSGRVRGRGSSTAGFTLIEMMIAVAITAILVVLAVLSVQRTRNRLDAERATVELRGLIAQAQRLASVAGSRAGTHRLVAGPSCGNAVCVYGPPAAPGCPAPLKPNAPVVSTQGHIPTIAILNATQIEIPTGLQAITVGPNAEPALQMDCETFDFTAETGGDVAITVPAAAETYTVAPNGRLFGPNPTMHIQVTGTANPMRPYGFRVLSSGVICSSALPMPPALQLCDEDV
jgi:prepilin-type N-terminal cleavage/methylation domain-containing protein